MYILCTPSHMNTCVHCVPIFTHMNTHVHCVHTFTPMNTCSLCPHFHTHKHTCALCVHLYTHEHMCACTQSHVGSPYSSVSGSYTQLHADPLLRFCSGPTMFSPPHKLFSHCFNCVCTKMWCHSAWTHVDIHPQSKTQHRMSHHLRWLSWHV